MRIIDYEDRRWRCCMFGMFMWIPIAIFCKVGPLIMPEPICVVLAVAGLAIQVIGGFGGIIYYSLKLRSVRL